MGFGTVATEREALGQHGHAATGRTQRDGADARAYFSPAVPRAPWPVSSAHMRRHDACSKIVAATG